MGRVLSGKVVAGLAMSLALFSSSYRGNACTTAIVSAEASATGRPLLWKQRDTGNPFNTIVNIPASEGHFAYTALFNVSDTSFKSAYAGSNEKGFAIVNNMSYNLASGKYEAKNGSLMRQALERCVSVEDFESFLRSLPERGCESNFGVIDSSGAAAFFEVADSSLTRFDVPKGGWLVRSNYSLSGRSDDPSGYARYETAFRLMEKHTGKFTPHFLIDGLGRSWYNAVLGYDASRRFRNGMAYDEDFIPRPTTVSSICFDGPELMWAAVGYTPASYAMPLEVCGNLPGCLVGANAIADSLKHVMHPLPRDASKKYIDFRTTRRISGVVRSYERRAAGLVGNPKALDDLFEEFRKEFEKD